MVFISGVQQKFLHVWLSVHRIKESELSLTLGGHGTGSHKRQYIGNLSIARRIKNDYIEFRARNTDLENFFDRSIIEFKQIRSDRPFTTRIETITRNPVFVFKRQNVYCLQPNTKLKAWKPIQMSLRAIFSIYDIQHDFNQDRLIDEAVALQEPNDVDVNFYLLDNNKAYRSKSLPGFRESGNRIIHIAVHDNMFYWLPSSNLITQRFYCQKLPGKCLFWAERKLNVEEHEKICSDESIVRAKQV